MRLGATCCRPSRSWIPRRWRSSPVNALIAIGTSWMFASRLVAVTVISSMPPAYRRAGSSAVASSAGATSAASPSIGSSSARAQEPVPKLNASTAKMFASVLSRFTSMVIPPFPFQWEKFRSSLLPGITRDQALFSPRSALGFKHGESSAGGISPYRTRICAPLVRAARAWTVPLETCDSASSELIRAGLRAGRGASLPRPRFRPRRACPRSRRGSPTALPGRPSSAP